MQLCLHQTNSACGVALHDSIAGTILSHSFPQQQQGLPWITELLTKDYGDLSLGTRVDILTTLVQLALDSPSARIIMEERVAAAARIRKQMWEEARVWVVVGEAGQGG